MERCPCCERALNEQEDDRLFKHNQAHGEAYWPSLLKTAGLQRCEKSCQLRWIEFLKRCNISEDEEQLIIRLHALLGNRWSLIAGRLPGRTGKEIKNYWNTHIKRKLLGQGIDPESHQPINSADNESSSSNSHFFNHEIPAVDFFQNDGVGMSSDFEGSTSDAGKTNEGPSDVNLDLSIGLPLHNIERVDSKEVSD